MKIRKISSITQFNPDKVVSSPDIFSRKTENLEDGELKFTSEQKQFNDAGIFSKRIFGSLDSKNEYSCDCGKYVGKVYEGIECSECKTRVELIEANINKIGWIDLGEESYLIKYVSYMMLEKVIGKENMRNIIHVPNTITIEGNLDLNEIQNLQNSDPEKKYWYIGIQEFKNRYAEILTYYHELHEKKEKDHFEFLEDSDDVFTNKIPVISVVLRPVMRTDEGLKLDEINNTYINILKNVKILRDKTENTELIKNITIETIQSLYFQLSEEILENIKSKAGLIRNQIMGTRVNFSARNIISPARAGYKIDEVILPYLTFLNLYKYEIMNIISKVKNIRYTDAQKIWYQASLKVDEEIYMIMQKMITDEEIAILLNRNPTISYGSILYLRVAGIKKDYEDLTTSIHNTILSPLAGDYDGDVLNIISIKDREMKEIFKEVFSPVNLIIDSNNGHFNSALNLERDQVLGINNLLI
jgi:DNA-directed RNA polymerase beta' subunit